VQVSDDICAGFQVHLENIGAADIVDGNPRLILGLIWTIIRRFHIQEIEIEIEEVSHGRTGCSWTLHRVREHEDEVAGAVICCNTCSCWFVKL
jgi:hypothetical protein